MIELYNLLKATTKISMELVDDIEYYDKFIEGIVIYFEDGTTFQICKDVDNHVSKDNSYMLIDENLGVRLTINDSKKMMHEVVKLVEKRNSEIEDLIYEEINLPNIELTFKDGNFYMKNSNKKLERNNIIEYIENIDRSNYEKSLNLELIEYPQEFNLVYDKVLISNLELLSDIFCEYGLFDKKYYRMNDIDNILNEISKIELLSNLDKNFNGRHEYFYIEKSYCIEEHDKYCSINQLDLEDIFLDDWDYKIRNFYEIFIKDYKKIYNMILDYLEL